MADVEEIGLELIALRENGITLAENIETRTLRPTVWHDLDDSFRVLLRRERMKYTRQSTSLPARRNSWGDF